MHEELRRTRRVSVCCRVVGHDRYGMWTAVTEDVSARGCRIVTSRLLSAGSLLAVTLSSDLFPEELDVPAEAVWSTPASLGVLFLEGAPRTHALSPEAWLDKVIAYGVEPGSPIARVLPILVRPAARGVPAGRVPAPRPGVEGGGRVILLRRPLG